MLESLKKLIDSFSGIPVKVAIITLVFGLVYNAGNSAIQGYVKTKVDLAVTEALKVQAISNANKLSQVIELNEQLTLELVASNKQISDLFGQIEDGVKTEVITIITEGVKNDTPKDKVIDDVSTRIIDGMWSLYNTTTPSPTP